MMRPRSETVFLSHNSSDSRAVEALGLRLEEQGVSCWWSARDIESGEHWQEAIQSVLLECRSCVVFWGPHGPGSWMKAEIEVAISRHMSDPSFRVLIVRLPGGDGEAPPFLAQVQWVEFQSLDDPEAFERLLRGIQGVERTAGIARERKKGGPRLRNSRPWRLRLGAALLILLGLTGGGSLWHRGFPGSPPASRVSLRGHRVAVLGFENRSGDPGIDFLNTALLSALPGELGRGGELLPVSEESLARLPTEILSWKPGPLGKASLRRIRGLVGAELAVLGSYSSSGGRLQLEVRVEDTNSGQVLALVSEEGRLDDVLDLIFRLSAKLRRQLGLDPLSQKEVQAARAALPVSTEALRLYSDGIAKLKKYETAAALESLEKAELADPAYPLIQSAQAKAWQAMGYEAKATAAAKKAINLAVRLPREDRLLFEAELAHITHQWDEAIHNYQILWTSLPGNLEYGLSLAEAQTQAGRGADALRTVAALQQKFSDPRIDLTEAAAAEASGQLDRQRNAAARAYDEGTRQGARFVMAKALLLKGRALGKQEDRQGALRAFQEAKNLSSSPRDPERALALNELANVHFSLGQLDLANQEYGDALSLYRMVGNLEGEAIQINGQAAIAGQRGDLAEAERDFRAVLKEYKETGNRFGQAEALGNLGLTLSFQGKLEESEKQLKDSLGFFRQLGDKAEISLQLGNLAVVRYYRLELDQAESGFQESAKSARAAGDQSGEAFALMGLGDIAMARADFPAAEESYQHALKLGIQLGEKGTVAQVQLALAELRIEKKQPGEAQALAERALAQFSQLKMRDNAAQAAAVLVKSLLVQGKIVDARKKIAEARKLTANSQSLKAMVLVTLTEARVQIADGKLDLARNLLGDAKKNVRASTGYGVLEFDTRLAQGELEAALSDPVPGRELLKEVEKDARAKGYSLVAERAKRLLSRSQPPTTTRNPT